jgi:hypothetical protein
LQVPEPADGWLNGLTLHLLSLPLLGRTLNA